MRSIGGKKTLVTGAASGIGRAMAVKLAEEGADLFLVDKNPHGLASVALELKRHGVNTLCHVCDLCQVDEIQSAVQRLIAEWGTLDILINNAGICYYGPTDAMSDEQWDQVLGVNLLAPIQLTQQLLPHLLSRPEAHIVNVCSVYGLFASNRCTAYHTTKFAMVGLSESLRAEYSRYGLGVTALCPGLVHTNLYESMDVSGKRPKIPRGVGTTPSYVAARAIQGIYRDQRLVLVTPMAHAIYLARRIAPGLIDAMYRFGRRRKMREKQAHLAADQSQPARKAA